MTDDSEPSDADWQSFLNWYRQITDEPSDLEKLRVLERWASEKPEGIGMLLKLFQVHTMTETVRRERDQLMVLQSTVKKRRRALLKKIAAVAPDEAEDIGKRVSDEGMNETMQALNAALDACLQIGDEIKALLTAQVDRNLDG